MQDPTQVATDGGVVAQILGCVLAAAVAAVATWFRGWLKARATQAWAATLLGAIDVAKEKARAGLPGEAAGVRLVTTAIGRAVDWAPEAVKRTHAAALTAAGANGTAILGPILAAGQPPQA